MHKLDITYHNTFNCRSLKIEDNSVYNDLLSIDNIILEVRPPGQNCFEIFKLHKDWKSITLNCSSLKLCCTKQPCEFTTLPDGIYDLKYSLNPNDKTLIEFSHMRVCSLMSEYIKVVGIHLANICNNDKKDNEKIEKKLLEIKDKIDNSVYAVEELLDNELGLELYQEAQKEIKKINNGNFKNCC